MKAFLFWLALTLLGSAQTLGPGRHPALARDAEGHLFLAYENRGDICFRRSDNQGASWSEEVALCTTPASSQAPRLVADRKGGVEVVWQEGGELALCRSLDGGGHFSAVQTLGPGTEPDLCLGPDDSLHLVFIDGRDNPRSPDVYYRYSFNQGQSWSVACNTSRTPGICSHPTVAVHSTGMVQVAWLDTSSGDHRPDVFATRGTQDTFSPPVNLSNTAGVSQAPRIVTASSGRCFVAWMDNSRTRQIWDIYFAFADSDRPFSAPIYFATPGDSFDPCLTLDEQSRLVVAWSDASESRLTPDVYLVYSLEAGLRFSPPKNISHTPGYSRFPAAVVVEDTALLVWEELEQDVYWLKSASERLPRKPRNSSSGGKY